MINIPALSASARKIRLTSLAQQSVRAYAGYWNKDWRPGPYPKTEEQRRAAAKKYGMIPEDYEPYPDDGTGYGDYPKLPIVSAESRDPHRDYDCDELKRNYGEVLHVDADLYGEDRWDYSRKYPISLLKMNLSFFGTIGTAILLFWIGQQYRICFLKKMPPQKPSDGQKHYTFELE